MDPVLLLNFNDVGHVSLDFDNWEVVILLWLSLIVKVIQSFLEQHLFCKLSHWSIEPAIVLDKGLKGFLVMTKLIDQLSWELPSFWELMVESVKLKLICLELDPCEEIVKAFEVHRVDVLLLLYSFSDNRLIGKADRS